MAAYRADAHDPAPPLAHAPSTHAPLASSPARPTPSVSLLRARFAGTGAASYRERLFESGALRLRLPRGPGCEGVIVNTGGGIVGGDRLSLAFDLAAGSAVTLTSVASEKIYRSPGPDALIETALTLGAGASLDWLPQETILFDAARLRRRLAVDMVDDSRCLAAEMVVFGRLARAETDIKGCLRDSWRVRRGGRLVFADESRLEGAIAATLDRTGVAGGARAAALLLLAAPDAATHLDPLRAVMDAFRESGVRVGASLRDGILVARALAHSPDRLRAFMVAALGTLRAAPLPRVWI